MCLKEGESYNGLQGKGKEEGAMATEEVTGSDPILYSPLAYTIRQ